MKRGAKEMGLPAPPGSPPPNAVQTLKLPPPTHDVTASRSAASMIVRRPLAAAFLAAGLLSLGLSTVPAASAENIDRPITGRTFIDVAEKALPAVISLDVRVKPSDRLIDQMNDPNQAQDPFALWRRLTPEDFPSFGSGSGVVVRVDAEWAYAITNRHVLDGNTRVEYSVKLDENHFPDTREISGDDVEVVGSDELTDIAVIRFRVPDGVEIEPAEFADSDEVEIGEMVVALGNPLELNNSVSQGIVSALNRDISDANRIEQLLQTTAVINPGNSGGPLVNLDGRIVGINNAIATNTGQWSGVGFAIPSNTARRVGDLLIQDGRISRGFLGITMTESEGDGVSVVDVTPATPAATAGVEIGDIVIEVDGKRVKSSRALLAEIGNRFAGEEIELNIRRREKDDTRNVVVKVKLTERPSEDVLLSRQRLMQHLGADGSEDAAKEMSRLGVSAEPDRDGGTDGMRVTRVEPGSPAGRAGLRAGDVVVQVNGIDAESEESLLQGLANAQEGRAHVILFRREGSNQFVTIDRE